MDSFQFSVGFEEDSLLVFDWLVGRKASDWLAGRKASDWLVGRKASDWLAGRKVSDWLAGRKASDWLAGRKASDWLAGSNRLFDWLSESIHFSVCKPGVGDICYAPTSVGDFWQF